MSESKKTKVRILCADKIFARMLVLELADSGITASIQPPAATSPENDGAISIIDADSLGTTPRASANTLYFGFSKAPNEVSASYLQRPFAITAMINRIESIISSLHSEEFHSHATQTNVGAYSGKDNITDNGASSAIAASDSSDKLTASPSSLSFDADAKELRVTMRLPLFMSRSLAIGPSS